jgi:hypothetical protein
MEVRTTQQGEDVVAVASAASEEFLSFWDIPKVDDEIYTGPRRRVVPGPDLDEMQFHVHTSVCGVCFTERAKSGSCECD